MTGLFQPYEETSHSCLRQISLLGNLVSAEGRYQTDKDGKPRLLFIDRYHTIEQTLLST